ncbi:MAG: 2-oxo-3-hexenedioate decarboxylase [Thermoleophilaceae bacterium]|jgi:2-keto-4-pentenoate hydratase|nr:2-oxo-3-hexenedioate decarboxylase [Thermoleophilaceae bacterium]
MLVRRREMLAQGAEPVGWKIGFNVSAAQEKLGIDGPLAGFLTTDGLLEDGAEVSLDDGPVVVESEVAVELGDDARTVVALLPALEVADPPDLDQGVETILAGNIFHRAVAFGPRVATQAPGAARILVNGEEQHALTASETSAHLEAMVDVIARRLAEAGEELVPGQRIITGVLAPPHAAQPGDRVRLELDAVGAVELLFA